MKQLSGLDATFLSLETDNAPMHIAGVAILDARTPRGRFGLDELKAMLLARLDRSRTFTERLVEVPLKLGNPYWTADENFDIDRHVERTQLPEPGGWKELSALVSWELGQKLPRDRPLWQMLFVEGVDGIEGAPKGSVAVISRIHHAAIDGVSGSDILSALFDLSPDPPAEESGTPARSTENGAEDERPNRLGLLRKTGKNLVDAPGAITDVVGKTVKGLVQSGAVWGLKKVKPPPLLFTAPRTRLNVPIHPERVWSPALLSLDRIKEIRRAVDATVNDVVLAICAGALRRYLLEKDDLPEKPLVAMVPISVRAEDERGTMGNQVSAMLVSLATDVADPLERLRRLRQGAVGSKLYHHAIGARTLSGYSELIPFALGGLAARLYTRMHLADRHKPIFNLVITNVPGPQVPLYIGGARLLSHIGSAPIFDGVGLMLPIFSYDGTLTIGATSDRELMPDIHVFARYLRESLDELAAAVAETSGEQAAGEDSGG